jgi:hypothetical protein
VFPVDAAKHPETLRRHTLKAGEELAACAAIQPETPASAVVVTLDSTFIRSCEDGERHLEVRVGNVETTAGGRQVFGAVAKADTSKADTSIEALIGRELDAVGRTKDTTVTAFTDGCPGLRRSLADAGITTTPMLDWFHVGMRLQHLKQIAGALSADHPARAVAKAAIVAEVERLHWRIWSGKADGVARSRPVADEDPNTAGWHPFITGRPKAAAVPFKLHAEHRHHIPKRRSRVTNWPDYDAALRQRGSLKLWFTDEAIAAWRAEPRTTPGGQPYYSALAITTALMNALANASPFRSAMPFSATSG